MLVPKEKQLLVCRGNRTPTRFKYRIERSMDRDISSWLDRTFKRGHGVDYYYSYGEIWFKRAKQETLFLLMWP